MIDWKKCPEVAAARKNVCDDYKRMRAESKPIARLVWKAAKRTEAKIERELLKDFFF